MPFSATGCFPGTIVASAFGQLDAPYWPSFLGPCLLPRSLLGIPIPHALTANLQRKD